MTPTTAPPLVALSNSIWVAAVVFTQGLLFASDRSVFNHGDVEVGSFWWRFMVWWLMLVVTDWWSVVINLLVDR